MRHEVAAAIRESGIVGIVRSKSSDEATQSAIHLLESGLRAVEVSLVTPQALTAIRHAANTGLGFVGAGTVLYEPSAIAAIEAGATFLVSPILNPAVVAAANRYGVACLPGVATPTEAIRALEMGADFAKLFPASAYGPGAVKDILTALPHLPLVPTGGVRPDDALSYIAAGSAAVGLGSALSSGSVDESSARIQTLLRQIERARIV